MRRLAQIHDLEIPYEIIYRDIRCPRLEFKTGDLHLIVPINYHNPESLITRHKKWIYNQAKFINETLKGVTQISLCEKRTDLEFKELITFYVSTYARQLGVHPKKVTIKKMKSRWGSCSISTGNITLNSYLKYLPKRSIRYIIFHELTHLIRRNHDRGFWELISRKFPDYKEIKKNLLGYWYLVEKNLISNKKRQGQ